MTAKRTVRLIRMTSNILAPKIRSNDGREDET
jgi:hypothetical protein